MEIYKFKRRFLKDCGPSIISLLFIIGLLLYVTCCKQAKSETPKVVNVEFGVDEELNISKDVFKEVSNAFNDGGFGCIFMVIESDLPNVFPMLCYDEDFYKRELRNHRHLEDCQHVLIVQRGVETQTFGWTVCWPEVSDTFSQYHLNSVSSVIFVDNINLDRQDSRGIIHGINWSDSIVTADELLIKVIIHEIGHQYGLSDNYSDIYSVMHQGDDIQTVQGPNDKGPRFSKEDIEKFRFDQRLGIERVKKL